MASLVMSMPLSAQITYPQTMEMHNPLFTQFGSPMFNTPDQYGNLYTADPSAHVWADGRLYVYASHDMEPAQGCDRMDRYHVFSTDDMLHWTDHGEILKANDLKSMGWDCAGFMWAPDCAYNPADETYYYYFPHPTDLAHWGTTWRIGVATSKNPAEGFQTIGWIENVPPHIDPCVFVDDDGQPYLYVGGGGKCFGGKLRRDDWTKLDGEMQPMTGMVDFHEGTWVHKHNGTYYLSHPDNHGGDGNNMRYAMGNSPLGPWVDKGVILYPTGCETSHGSIVDFKDKAYLFYHCCNVSGKGELRSVCVDEITYNEDGTLNVVRNWGSPFAGTLPVLGTNGMAFEGEDFNVGPLNYGFYKHADYAKGNNTTYRDDEYQFVNTIDGRVCAQLTKGEWARYSFKVNNPGRYSVVVTVKSASGTSQFHLSMNGDHIVPKSYVGTSWKPVEAVDVIIPRGEHYLDMRIDNGSVYIDKIELIPAAPYEGRVYDKGNHDVPGVVEAEDFDFGGEGVAYHDATPTQNQGGYNYRTEPKDIGVDIENSEGSIHTSWGSSGEWMKYTVNCTQDGMYNISCRAVNANGGGLFNMHLIVDDVYVYDLVSWQGPAGNWSASAYGFATTEGVELSKGKHVVTVVLHSDGNVDYLQFTRTGDTAVSTVNTTPLSSDCYNVSGMKVPSNSKGLVITNGKKVLQ